MSNHPCWKCNQGKGPAQCVCDIGPSWIDSPWVCYGFAIALGLALFGALCAALGVLS